jgi:hypothetical protein
VQIRVEVGDVGPGCCDVWCWFSLQDCDIHKLTFKDGKGNCSQPSIMAFELS